MATPDALTAASLAALHFENSSLTHATLPYLAERIRDYTMNQEEVCLSAEAYRTYPGAPRLALPKCRVKPRLSLADALGRRRSSAEFTGDPIGFDELAQVLRGSYGITDPKGLRAAPSAGALYPIEVNPTCLRVKDVPMGFYHYHVREDALEALGGDPSEQLAAALVTHSKELKCACLVILTAVWERTLAKYGERGYRFLMLDAGHVAQNLILLATALGLRSCPIGGFIEDDLAAALRLDRKREWVVYAIAIGR